MHNQDNYCSVFFRVSVISITRSHVATVTKLGKMNSVVLPMIHVMYVTLCIIFVFVSEGQ